MTGAGKAVTAVVELASPAAVEALRALTDS
jgi:hypothetical protein